MLMNLSENFWILLCCLLTSSFAIMAWIRAIIVDHKMDRLSDQLEMYVEASVNMSLHSAHNMRTITPVNKDSTRRHILSQAQACARNGLTPSDIQVEFGLREDEIKLMRALPKSTVKGLKRRQQNV